MTAIYYTIGVLIFVVAILASIGLHELGHMIPAKKFGGKVTQYFIGFGPTVWSKRVGETEYGLKAIPLGGYVKIIGMLPPGAADITEREVDEEGNEVIRIRKSNTGLFTQLVSDARAAEWELITPEDDGRLFYKMSWWKKVVVMAGGPTVNVLIAFFLFWLAFSTLGNPRDPVLETTVGEVSACVVPAAESGRICTDADVANNPSPAYRAGLQPGDQIVSFNGQQISTWQQMQELIRNNGSGEAVLGVLRDGQSLTLATNTQVEARAIDPDNPQALTRVGFLGVTPQIHLATGGPIYTVRQMDSMVIETVQSLATLPVKVFDVAKALVGLQERDPQGPVSIVGGGRLAGEVAADERFPIEDKALSLIMLIGGFNLFIGLFNFVPLLPLDGGHIAGALWEAVRRGIAKLRRRPDPGYVDVAKLLPIAYVVAMCFAVMSVILIAADLIIPIRLT